LGDCLLWVVFCKLQTLTIFCSFLPPKKLCNKFWATGVIGTARWQQKNNLKNTFGVWATSWAIFQQMHLVTLSEGELEFVRSQSDRVTRLGEFSPNA
jgi:hypothetical protein